MLKLQNKQTIVNEVLDSAKKAISIGVADYRGLTVTEMTDLRIKARNNGVHLRVVRNTLAKIAIENTNYSCISHTLQGPVFLLFAEKDPSAVARLLKEATRDFEKIVIRGIALSGKLLSVDDIDFVATLPNIDQARTLLVTVLKAPIVKLVRTLIEPHTMFVRTIAAIRDKK